MPERYYTVAEANSVLPEVRQVFGQMLVARQEVLDMQPELWHAVAKAVNNGGGRTLSADARQIIMIQQILQVLNDMGIQVKDLNTGLIDFPARYHGRTVLLCWQYDEPSVQFWHEIDVGFAGRQRIIDWD